MNYPTQLHLVGHFYENCIMMHGTVKVKDLSDLSILNSKCVTI